MSSEGGGGGGGGAAGTAGNEGLDQPGVLDVEALDRLGGRVIARRVQLEAAVPHVVEKAVRPKLPERVLSAPLAGEKLVGLGDVRVEPRVASGVLVGEGRQVAHVPVQAWAGRGPASPRGA